MTNEDIFAELMHEAWHLGVFEKTQKKYSKKLKKVFPDREPRDYGEKVQVLEEVMVKIRKKYGKV